ncbi:MAG: DUF1801 domain-containing protein [Xanthobacteraceae bacterium]|nr:DUF1801 domain-containing protein [Xanthobacteraceae bacterium]QYK43942.1 MAG: DUF1801 domain-containing protein [Xanthobacteraceae bacterium]
MRAKKRKPVRPKLSGRLAADDVASVFRSYPPKLRGKLLALRRLILDTAAKTEGVGALEETLKWGQPSYLTSDTGSGTTIRIDRMKRSDDRYAIFFHCQSGLVPMFRDLYGDKFEYEGKRALLLRADEKPDEKALAHCVSLALTHHARKKKQK